MIQAFIEILLIGDNFNYYLLDHLWASLFRVLIGLFYAMITAIPLGILVGLSKELDWFFTPIIEILRPIPPIAWIPFALVFFGFGLISQSFIIFIGAFFPIFSNTINGIRNVSPIYIDVAKTLGADRFDILLIVILPSSLPDILVGIRVALGVGWMCVIAAELVGLRVPLGLGYLIQYSAQFGNFDLTFAIMLTTGFIGLGISYGLKALEKYLFKWRASNGKN
ncbi:MAG: ABC transporter permease subunit [Candidatus Lokiarchaeota archaeon]|nr:ABC transporter permease subunit [Candidatus Lokiarchaeota archaeon]